MFALAMFRLSVFCLRGSSSTSTTSSLRMCVVRRSFFRFCFRKKEKQIVLVFPPQEFHNNKKMQQNLKRRSKKKPTTKRKIHSKQTKCLTRSRKKEQNSSRTHIKKETGITKHGWLLVEEKKTTSDIKTWNNLVLQSLPRNAVYFNSMGWGRNSNLEISLICKPVEEEVGDAEEETEVFRMQSNTWRK